MLRNVASGEFLDSDVKYPFCKDVSAVWEGGHTDLRTRPRDDASANQRWVFDEDHKYHGGFLLRHFRDGRGVDVHGWKTDNDGNNVGVENSVHGDCKGIVWVLSVEAEATSENE